MRLSAGALRFLGAAGFLKGSAPEDFAHLWHKNPGGGTAAMVYLVWKRYHRDGGGTPPTMTYHSKLLFTPRTVFETPDRWSGGFIRVFNQGGISVLVVIIVFIFCLLCFSFQLRLGSFGELPLLWFRGFLWFIQFIRIIPIGRLLGRLADKTSAMGV